MAARSRWLLALALAAGFASLVLAESSAQELPTFRTTSALVRVPAVVFASGGGPAMELTVDDFKITEEGEERPISVFSGPDTGPLEVALLVDSSGSMKRWPVKEATMALLDSLDPGSCVLLLPFTERVHKGVWGHPADELLRATVEGLELDGDEVIYDALLAALQLMRTRVATEDQQEASSGGEIEADDFADLMRFRAPGRALGPPIEKPIGDCRVATDPATPDGEAAQVRRVIAMVSDGEDHASFATIEDVLLAAWGGNVPVFAFAVASLPKALDSGVRSRTREWLVHFRELQRLAEYSGGIVFRATVSRYGGGGAFLDGVERLGAALRSHYVLGYVPSKSVDPDALLDRRSIKISVRRGGFDVLAPSDLALGRGASEGAALDLALRGFHQLATDNAPGALGTFEVAASLGHEIGLVHLGRGIALSALERPIDAVAALRTAAALAPWLPDLDARMAELLVSVGDLDGAWRHVLRAYRDGSEVLDLIGLLQQRAPRNVDLVRLGLGRRIRLLIGGTTSAIGTLAAEPLLAALGREIAESDLLSLGYQRRTAQTVLRLEIREAKRRGAGTSVSGWLALENMAGQVLEDQDGKKLLERRFSLEDSRSDEELRSLAAAVVAEMERLFEVQ